MSVKHLGKNILDHIANYLDQPPSSLIFHPHTIEAWKFSKMLIYMKNHQGFWCNIQGVIQNKYIHSPTYTKIYSSKFHDIEKLRSTKNIDYVGWSNNCSCCPSIFIGLDRYPKVDASPCGNIFTKDSMDDWFNGLCSGFKTYTCLMTKNIYNKKKAMSRHYLYKLQHLYKLYYKGRPVIRLFKIIEPYKGRSRPVNNLFKSAGLLD